MITTDKFVFVHRHETGGEVQLWKINDATLHMVDNRSDQDRFRLIVDRVPNSTVRPENKRPPGVARSRTTRAVAWAATSPARVIPAKDSGADCGPALAPGLVPGLPKPGNRAEKR